MAGCSQAPEETNTAETESTAQTEVADTTPQAAPEIGSWGFDLTGMNTEVHPGNDFNKYANGQWLDTKEIPSDRARWGIFDKLRERSTEQVNVIIDDLIKSKNYFRKIPRYLLRTWIKCLTCKKSSQGHS